MDRINLNFNELLRSFFAGVWGLAWLFLLTIDTKSRIISAEGLKDVTVLIFIALILGIFTYSIHRAIVYPNLYKIVLVGLAVFKKIKWDWFLLIPFYPSPTEKLNDFRRWKERQKEKSISSNLVEWGSQIHLLYCSSWTLLIAIEIAKHLEICEPKYLDIACWTFGITLFSSFVHHFRFMVYDIETEKNENH